MPDNNKNPNPPRKLSSRRAITLIEMLFVTAALVVMTAFTAKMYHQVLGNFSRTHRDFQANTSLHDMLRQLRNDVESSDGLLRYPANEKTGPDLLLIDSPQGTISWEFDNGRIFRVSPIADLNQSTRDAWPTPHAHIEWRLLPADGNHQALAITTSIERTVADRLEMKLRNSHVFFTGIAAGDEN